MLKSLVCPKCHGNLKQQSKILGCKDCKTKYSIKHGIPSFINSGELLPPLKISLQKYETLHQKPWSHLTDGSYEILAAIARGNRTLDIACGDGFLEELAPLTIGLDFSLHALLKAQKKGARFLVQATAEALPFNDNSFDLTICSGSLEHFADPQKAIAEMVRVSRIQLLIIHTSVPGHAILTKLFRVKHQPIERPMSVNKVERMLQRVRANIIYKGVWTLPVNYGRVIKFLPEFKFLPSSSFVISIKHQQ